MNPIPGQEDWGHGIDHLDVIHRYMLTVIRKPGSHGPDHTERVVRLCRRIGEREGADPAILVPAALLHDIARPQEKEGGTPHEIAGAAIAEEYLRAIGYDEGRIPAIAHAIRAHRYRGSEAPASLEAKILSDADKLDAMGAVGIARTFLRAAEHGGGMQDALAHVGDKLLRLKDRLFTDSARQIAGERHAFLVTFAETLRHETEP